MLNRREVVKELLKDRPQNLLAVSSLGSSTWDLTDAGIDNRNFCFIGAMGQAGPFAFGLAMAQPKKRVVLFSGDGEMLMSLGILATIANQEMQNLSIIVLDNEAYLETGGQPTATAGKTNLEEVAKGCGIPLTQTITCFDKITNLRETIHSNPCASFSVVKISDENLPLVFPPSFDGATAMNTFRNAAMLKG